MNKPMHDAILNRTPLTISYQGLDRTIEVHAHGLSKKGEEVIRAYQTSGGSESGQSAGWKLFKVAGIMNIRPNGLAFGGPREGYKRDDSAMISIFGQL